MSVTEQTVGLTAEQIKEAFRLYDKVENEAYRVWNLYREVSVHRVYKRDDIGGFTMHENYVSIQLWSGYDRTAEVDIPYEWLTWTDEELKAFFEANPKVNWSKNG
jgi:hypothetical protein